MLEMDRETNEFGFLQDTRECWLLLRAQLSCRAPRCASQG